MRETWTCNCRDVNGKRVLRPASREKCARCGMKAPWAEEEKRSW